MYPFEFDMTTKAIFGEGAVARVGELAAGFGKKALLITYDEKFVKEVGFYQKVADSCKAAGVTLLSAFGVKSNPTVEHAAGVIALAKKEKPDVLIALGGGSAMDEAKFVGVAAGYDGDPWDFATGKTPITKTLPLIAVVTIPATSSELNGTSVMSYEKIQRKDGFLSPLMRPKFAVLDPELTYTIPLKQTAYSAADIVSHLLEAYIGHGLDWAPFQEHYCQGSIRTIMECMDRILANPRDKEARAQMMWTASYAWNGFYPCGLGPADATIHVLGHSLSNFYDTPHGAAMSVTIPATMRYFLNTKTKRLAGIAREVFAVREADDLAAAKAGIAAIVAWFKKIGTPTTLGEAGIPNEAIAKMAPDALKTAQAWGLGDLYSLETCVKMFELCK
ncbi:MAG TPA: iron-containing alcohol dehydrogenase [Spirochaetia bacterium]|nr:iron-containing alcohol dehydrogenase [Spirochaetales bacterium]HRY79292.1 iron-containing alcohol dehydrogenase [Spirochaetia bacterium]HRZ89641.1 iron-containing alcohol dehydrogenase [Spirochaetia bacterium]